MPRNRAVYAPAHERPAPTDWLAHFAEADRLRAEEARIAAEAMKANEATLNRPAPIESILTRLAALEDRVAILARDHRP